MTTYTDAAIKTAEGAFAQAKVDALNDRPGHALAALADGMASVFAWMVAVENERWNAPNPPDQA